MKKNTVTATSENEVVVIGTQSMFNCMNYAHGDIVIHTDSFVNAKDLKALKVLYYIGENPDIIMHGSDGVRVVSLDWVINHMTVHNNRIAINRELNALRLRTYNLIKDNNIPMSVVSHIDDHLPSDLLSLYEIEIGGQLLLQESMSTYHPTEVQRNAWGVSDRDFSFTPVMPKMKYTVTTTLYDKLVAWLQLQYFIKADVPIPYKPPTVEEQISNWIL